MDDTAATLLKHRRAAERDGDRARPARAGGMGRPRQRHRDRPSGRHDRASGAHTRGDGGVDGERLRGALTELGTTYIKFGQMLSLRPDLVGEDVANELSKLQATVPADPPGVAQRNAEAQLGRPVSELFGSFEAEPFASGSVAQVHRATLVDGTAVAVKVLHDGADVKVHEDLELMQAVAAYLENEDPELAQLRPTILVAEFAGMMTAAVDLREELLQPPTLPAELRRRAGRGHPRALRRAVPAERVDHGDDLGPAVHRPSGRGGGRMGRRRRSCSGRPTCTWR